MGMPMLLNLAKALRPGSRIFVYDVAPAAVEEAYTSLPNVVVKCGNAREVAEKSVGLTPDPPLFSVYANTWGFAGEN